jgi:cobalamin biosynthesis protein CobD/CbiB
VIRWWRQASWPDRIGGPTLIVCLVAAGVSIAADRPDLANPATGAFLSTLLLWCCLTLRSIRQAMRNLDSVTDRMRRYIEDDQRRREGRGPDPGW